MLEPGKMTDAPLLTRNAALLTDSYQLSMMQAYLENQMTGTAVFELFVRRLPKNRNFLIAVGLEQVISYLESLSFTQEELNWLESTNEYKPKFLDYLRHFRFSGDLDAMREGTVFFPNEPIIRIMAPLPEAQLVESRLINIIHFQTMIASKAIRVRLVSSNQSLVEFGLRRSHGAEAGLLAARASYIGGFSGTATMLAGQTFQIPVFGTMAHSFIQAHDTESLAFEHFALSRRLSHDKGNATNITLLIDTYDTERAAQKVVDLAAKLAKQGIHVDGVRLDSGDLKIHAKKVRKILDKGNLKSTKIFASGNLDEQEIQKLLRARAPIDGFGVGTALSTSADAPYLDFVYKLQEYAGRARRKKSEGKATWPGRKQVYRHRNRIKKKWIYDVLTSIDQPDPWFGPGVDSTPLLQPFIRNGKRLSDSISVDKIRDYVSQQLESLPSQLLHLGPAKKAYSVKISPDLLKLAKKLDLEIASESDRIATT